MDGEDIAGDVEDKWEDIVRTGSSNELQHEQR